MMSCEQYGSEGERGAVGAAAAATAATEPASTHLRTVTHDGLNMDKTGRKPGRRNMQVWPPHYLRVLGY